MHIILPVNVKNWLHDHEENPCYILRYAAVKRPGKWSKYNLCLFRQWLFSTKKRKHFWIYNHICFTLRQCFCKVHQILPVRWMHVFHSFILKRPRKWSQYNLFLFHFHFRTVGTQIVGFTQRVVPTERGSMCLTPRRWWVRDIQGCTNVHGQQGFLLGMSLGGICPP